MDQYKKMLGMMSTQERQINEIIDDCCKEIDNKNSSTLKTKIIMQELKEADDNVSVMTRYVNMQSEAKQYIFDQSFRQPWIQFRDMLNQIKKSTKYLTIVGKPEYSLYYHFFSKGETKLKYTDCEHCLDIRELSSCAVNYAKFYDNLKNIFNKMRDVQDYKEQIKLQSQKIIKMIDQKIPGGTQKDYAEVRPFMTEFFQRIFRYKLSFGLANKGKLPSIMELLKDPETMIQMFDKYDKKLGTEKTMVDKQAKFLFSYVSNMDATQPGMEEFGAAIDGMRDMFNIKPNQDIKENGSPYQGDLDTVD